MRIAIRVATYAVVFFLLVGFTSAFNGAAAEETAALPSDEHTEPEAPPMHLNERIADLEAELVELRRQLDAMSAGTQPEDKRASDEERRDLIERIAEAEEDLSELRTEINGGELPWGWKLQLTAGGLSAPVMNGASSPVAMRYLEVDGRYVWANHLGIGGATSLLGLWITEDDQGDGAMPWVGSGRLYTIANWEAIAVTVGPEVTYLQNPTEGEQGFVLVTVPASLEFRPKRSFFVRVFVGPATTTELQRTSGLWLGFGIGIPLYPRWGLRD